MVSQCSRDWDIQLPHVEFAHNRSPSYAISHSPFEVCYRLVPLTPLDLIPIPQETKVSFKVKELHKQVRAHIKKVIGQYNAKANKNRTHLEC